MNQKVKTTAHVGWRVVRGCARFARLWLVWCWRARPWVALWLAVAGFTWFGAVIQPEPERSATFTAMWAVLGLGLGPGALVATWRMLTGWPVPWFAPRWLIAHAVRLRWPSVAAECGLARTAQGKRGPVLVAPPLARVRVRDGLLSLRVRVLVGQTLETIETAVPKIATAHGAVGHVVKPAGPTAVDVTLMTADLLADGGTALPPQTVTTEVVPMGARQDGTAWYLQIAQRHTLVVGCSGSGKGSMFWGIACGLAPAVGAGLVRLWGVDLKRGVELRVGAPLFTAAAATPAESLEVLRRVIAILDARGHAMAGTARNHVPTVDDPLDVVLIDELAILTAYTDAETKAEGARLLAEILTQGRALGVLIVACVQDPRKETIPARGLFTQTLALRLRSRDEVTMVLGEGMAALAPAHRINPAQPGTAWVVNDDGSTDKVRAAYWPDELIRATAERFAAPTRVDLSPAPVAEDEPERSRRKRSPRKPRAVEAVPDAPAEAPAEASAEVPEVPVDGGEVAA
ncbi:hypothetical protein L1785_12210 [Antribacter sp. KLBMP9083]|uniref:FtsK domain-containing protein n=1 Tax=Antribacter soli TaxID=2910976 RepID=A0AA41QEN1_9MICO|nr:FtsK/SpoIIIE domain-containing protein [Antribacter soli]MCF4121747.1 hypothetical protein [Antribacter soli]